MWGGYNPALFYYVTDGRKPLSFGNGGVYRPLRAAFLEEDV